MRGIVRIPAAHACTLHGTGPPLSLQDLEELREELEDDEYEEVRVDTLEQLEELQVQMDNFSKGNATLVSQLGAMRLAIEVRGGLPDAD